MYKHSCIRLLTCILFFHVAVGVALSETAASEDYAATLTVTHPGVTLQRANTQDGLPLPMDAVAPLGPGDRVQTDDAGRALISFWEGMQTLLLPDSTYQFDALESQDGALTHLGGTLSGIAVHRVASDAQPALYRVEMQNAVIVKPARWFATWAEPGEPFSMTVAEGDADMVIAGRTISLSRGQGVFGTTSTSEAVTFDPPWNAARLQGLLEGCPGVVDTITDVALRVRIGPGTGYVAMGGFDEAQSVQLMGINESEGWYRIQFLSGFGWMLKYAIETTCDTLPVLPDNTLETPRFIVDASEQEIEFLLPFFGSTIINDWFYQWSAP